MRAVFAPIFFLLYYIPILTASDFLGKVSACVMIPLLAFFEFTDYLDGHYARKHNEVSDLGKLFDPFADVTLNLTVFICAMHSLKVAFAYMPVLIFVLIMYREFTMMFIRMIASKQGVAIAARKGGKFKTVFYITSGFIFLTFESALRLGFDLSAIYGIAHVVMIVLFSICAVLSYASFVDYLVHFAELIKKDL